MSTTKPAISLCFLLLVPASLLSAQVGSQKQGSVGVASHPGPAIASPKYPRDLRGETVYEVQGADQKDEPVVPGTLNPPSAIKTVMPKFSKSLQRQYAGKDLTLEGVVAENGDFIDAHMVDSVDADFTKFVLDAVAKWKFHPGTLDGRPIAGLTRIHFNFRIY